MKRMRLIRFWLLAMYIQKTKMCSYQLLLLSRLEVYIKLAKESKCSQYKKYYYDFFPQSTLCPFCFYLVIPKHILGPYYACFAHVMGILDITCHWTSYLPFETFITHWKVMNANCASVSLNLVLENMNGAKGRLREKLQQFFCLDCLYFLWPI